MRALAVVFAVLLASSAHSQPGGAPTALVEGLGMRLYATEAPEPVLDLVVAGERVWLATGSTDSQVKSRVLYVEPSEDRDAVRAFYLRSDGTTASLPPPGTAPADPAIFNHEGTTIAAVPDLAVFLTNDGLGSPGYSYYHDVSGGALDFGVVRREGERWGNGAKNMAAAITETGQLVVLHSAAEPGHWPNLLASTDRARNFSIPSTQGRSGTQVLVVRLLPVRHADGREAVYVYWIRVGAGRHPLWGTVELVDGRPTITVLAEDYASLFPDAETETLPSGSATGPQPRWMAAWPTADRERAPGILMDTANRGLWLWDEETGHARLVENVYGDHTRDPRYFTAAESIYRLDPDGSILRLTALDPETVEPTWDLVSTIAFPDASWTDGGAPPVRGTAEGALWVYGRTPQTYPPTGVTTDDHALAYWAPGTALPATRGPTGR